MKSALTYREPQSPLSWQDLPQGGLMLEKINDALEPWTLKFFGYHLLKIGALSSEINCQQSPIKHHVTIASQNIESEQNVQSSIVIADVDDLPILEHSVDVCILGHELEFSVDPHHVLREASRVLIPNGYMVITGYNPISLAGFNKFLPYRRNTMPWREQFFTPMRVKDWLELMGFEILDDVRLLHRSLAGSSDNQGKLASFWQSFASRYLSPFGSVYLIVAKKRVHPLTPIKPKWRIRPSLQPARVPTMNSNKVVK